MQNKPKLTVNHEEDLHFFVPVTMASSTPPPNKAEVSSEQADEISSEDPSTIRLRRMWRSFASTIVVAARAASKAKDASDKVLDEAIVSVLRSRIDFRRNVTYVEIKLTGQAQEIEALEGCMRSQPSVGRKRKRDTEPPKHATGDE